MEAELDIVGLVQSLRVLSFLQKLFFKKRQRYFINKFKQYHISADVQEGKEKTERMDVEKMAKYDLPDQEGVEADHPSMTQKTTFVTPKAQELAAEYLERLDPDNSKIDAMIMKELITASERDPSEVVFDFSP